MRHEAYGEAHTARVRSKAEKADGLGEFWRGMMVSALDAIDRYRSRSDRYGVALMMIREGCADPKSVADDALNKESKSNG